MDILGLILAGIALALGVSVGEWVAYRTGKRGIGWPVGILVFFISLALLHRMI